MKRLLRKKWITEKAIRHEAALQMKAFGASEIELNKMPMYPI